jgi:hypothetical protein
MKSILAIIFIIFLSYSGLEAMAQTPEEKNQPLLSPKSAKEYALKGFNRNKWGYPKEYARQMKGAAAAEPLLVNRLDRKDSLYYILPFIKDSKTTLLIIIDAKTGAFKEMSYLKEPTEYPKIKKEDAKNILIDYLHDKKAEEKILMQEPLMVWKPSEQTQSPYEPLWEIHVGSKKWYIDQKGKVYDRIMEIRMKGGGM